MDKFDEITRELFNELLNEYEEKAWDGLARFRFDDFALNARLWTEAHKVSGERRTNPFQPVAALGRQMARDFHSGKR